MLRRYSSILVTVAALALFPGEANAMFSTPRMCMFSEISGTVVQNGKPVPGAIVERQYEWAWNNAKGTEKVVTNEKGEFRFPAVFRSSFIASFFPHEPVIEQHIRVHIGEATHDAWQFFKHNYEEGGELKSIKRRNASLAATKLQVICNLNESPKREDGVFGICRLVNE